MKPVTVGEFDCGNEGSLEPAADCPKFGAACCEEPFSSCLAGTVQMEEDRVALVDVLQVAFLHSLVTSRYRLTVSPGPKKAGETRRPGETGL